jgi:protein DJ-1
VGRLVREQEAADRMIASICGGGWALMKHGVAKGKKITSFPSFRKQMKELDANKEWTVIDEDRVVKDGKHLLFVNLKISKLLFS